MTELQDGRIFISYSHFREVMPKPLYGQLLVVDRDAAQWREKLAALHAEYFAPGTVDPLSPVQLEIVDRLLDPY